MVVEIGERYRWIASPIKLGRTPATYRLTPPKAGTKARRGDCDRPKAASAR